MKRTPHVVRVLELLKQDVNLPQRVGAPRSTVRADLTVKLRKTITAVVDSISYLENTLKKILHKLLRKPL